MRYHLPSIFFGFISAIALAVLLGANHSQSSVELRRFELEATSNHVFVLDRFTGKVWQKFVTEGSGQSDQDFALPKVK